MGDRVIQLQWPTAPTRQELSLLRQVVAFASFYSVGADLSVPKRYPATVEITIGGNSSFLNEFSPYLNDSIAQIAADIDPNSETLRSIASSIAFQLNEQIVDWSDVPGLVLARKGRELEERISGDSSFRQVETELGVHARRIQDELEKYQKATGPRAWRRRHDLIILLRIDSLALIAAARRLRRIADDVRRRLPGSHLLRATKKFDRATPHLIDLRNIAEHIDEYGIGRGRQDASELEPGDVFQLDINDDCLTIVARQHAVDVLAVHRACQSLTECLAAAIDRNMITSLAPPIADFDFVEYTEAGMRIIPRSNETDEHAQARSLIVSSINRTLRKLPGKRCPKCKNWL